MRSYYKLFTLFISFLFVLTDLQAQCLANPSGTATRVNNDCDYSVQMCIDVTKNGTKRLVFTLQYDTDGNGTADATQTYEIDPPGSTDLAQGTHCHTFTINNIVCNPDFVASMAAFQGVSDNSECGSVPPTIFTETNPLMPVELSQFYGVAEKKYNQLFWVTNSETNTAWHSLERSANGKDRFTEIARLPAAGNSSETKTYSITDNATMPLSYYRLRTIDLDGAVNFSPVVVVRRHKDKAFIKVFPNPIQGDKLQISVQFNQIQSSSLLRVIDITGKVWHQTELPTNSQVSYLEFDMSNLPTGTYFLSLFDGINHISEKFVK